MAPILLVVAGAGLFGHWKVKNGWPLLLIPVYWLLRLNAGAFLPSGDYGYNLSKLFVNSLANLSGYMLAIPLGPRLVDVVQAARLSLKQYIWPISLIGGGAIAVFVYVFVKAKGQLKTYRTSIVWFVCFILSLAAYLGLGGIAERNAIIPSGFFILFLSSLSIYIWTKNLWAKIVLCILIFLLVVWNVRELRSVAGDWKIASKISEQTLLSIKGSFFPLNTPTVFAFVNTPIRYGHAWIFPTGLPDALWLIYRDHPVYVLQPKSVSEAFAQTEGGMDRQILVFEDFILRKAIEEISVDQK